jgi:hypothetical protein
MNQAAARMPNVVMEALLIDHGEIDPSPMPAPSIRRASDNADAATAPAMIAAHETAEAALSPLIRGSRVADNAGAKGSEDIV